jgi:hypothetical protein
VEGPRDVLTWIMFGLAVWLGVGALTAWLLFGGSSYSWDEDDLEVVNVQRPSATVGSRHPAPTLQKKLRWRQKFRRLWAR